MQRCKNTSLYRVTWRTWLLAIAAVALLPFTVLNAQEDDGPSKPIDELVVTGTPAGSAIKKLDASYSITTIDEQDIEMFAPKSTADLLKLVPGVWSESSGGVSGANVFFRGFPGGGDAPFLTVQLEGSPIYPPPTLSFLENTTLFRIDETVERMEALRGGPNVVFSNGQPGLTTNFLLREGGEETEGLVKYTTSDYDLQRLDAFISGKISEDFYYMLGGYVKTSPGIRDAGFNSEEGQQITLNLTRNFDDGEVSFYHRNTDDHGTWYLPVALNVPGIDGDYTQVGPLNRQREIIFGPDDETTTLDLGDGRGWDGSVTGASFRFGFLDDWEFVDRVNFTTGNADTTGLVPDGGAVTVADFLANAAPGDLLPGVTSLTGAVTGRTIGDSEFVQNFGAWAVRKDIESFSNDLSISRGWDQANLTVGFFTSSFSVNELWSLGNGMIHVVQNGGEVVDGPSCNVDTAGCSFNFDLDATGDARTNAVFAAGDYSFGNWTLDAGVRLENYQTDYSADENLTGQSTFVVDGYDEDEFSWTAAANYAINDNMGAFARISFGSKFPSFDDFRDNQGPFETDGSDLIQDVEQYELGYKIAQDNWSLYATAFYTTVEPSFFVVISGATPGILTDNESIGLEIDGNYYHDAGFSVNVNATWMNAEIDGGQFDGNDQQRQPDWQFRITPAYEFDIGPTVLTLYGTFFAVDDRFSDPANLVEIDGYEKLDLGAILEVNRLTFQIVADNVTDDDGLTEGDPRDPLAPNGRIILPRSFKFSVAYAF